MRLISGKFGGRPLCSAVDDGLRPAMARTRESLFSMLDASGKLADGFRALDLFAGSGSLGLECLSRGAELAWFVDNGKAALGCLRKNISNLNMEDRCRVFQASVLRFLKTRAPISFNLVFIDPPYRRNLLQPTLDLLSANGWTLPGATVVAEIEKDAAPGLLAGQEASINRLFGQTRLCAWTTPG